MFSISTKSISSDEQLNLLTDHRSGALVVFEGRVRNHNQGLEVKSLEYQVYHDLALKEGHKIIHEAMENFNIHQVCASHREGHLALGDVAVWVGAVASHRDEAFKATRFVIDEIKHRLPVWKKEHYLHQNPEWVFCRDHHHHVHFEEKDFYQRQSQVIIQNKLKSARVLVVGLGGLGSPVAMSLAQAGIGYLKLVDFDKVCLSNLHRQSLFRTSHLGEPKAQIGEKILREINPFIKVESIPDYFHHHQLEDIDLVVDGTDNMQSKYKIHDACLKFNIPMVSAGLFKESAQVRTLIPQSGCWRCLNHEIPSDAMIGNCNDFGILGAWANTVGAIMASEAIEYLQWGKNATSHSDLHINLRELSSFKVKKVKNPDCEFCHGNFQLDSDNLEVMEGDSQDVLDIRNLSDDEVFNTIQINKKVILGCHKGLRSLELAKKFRSLGYQHIFSLKGGMNCCSKSC